MVISFRDKNGHLIGNQTFDPMEDTPMTALIVQAGTGVLIMSDGDPLDGNYPAEQLYEVQQVILDLSMAEITVRAVTVDLRKTLMVRPAPGLLTLGVMVSIEECIAQGKHVPQYPCPNCGH